MTPPYAMPTPQPPRTQHPQLIGAEGDERRDEHGGEGAFSISIAIETTQGTMMLPCDNRGYRVLLPGHSVEQTKVSCIHTGEKILKGTIY